MISFVLVRRPQAVILLPAILFCLLPASSWLAAAGNDPVPTAAPTIAAPPAPPADATPTPVAPTPTSAVPTPATAAPSPSASPAAVAAKGPLGATPLEIIKLYGPVLKHNARVRRHEVLEGGTALDGDLHGYKGVVVRVVYHAGHVVLLEYTRVAGALTPADVKTFLDATADGSVWVQGKDSSEQSKYYRRTDDRAIAHYATEYDGSLLIATEGIDHDQLLDNLMH